jgi:hypothetical protein
MNLSTGSFAGRLGDCHESLENWTTIVTSPHTCGTYAFVTGVTDSCSRCFLSAPSIMSDMGLNVKLIDA